MSTAEAEYVAQSNAAKEAMFLAQLLEEFGYDEEDVRPTRILGDNQSVIKMARNPVNQIIEYVIYEKYIMIKKIP